jgi:DNA-binding NarL/FixJ family response regulator
VSEDGRTTFATPAHVAIMPIRILLVDDHRILRDGLRLRLQQEPDLSIVGEATNAAEAYECLQRTPVDVVIMDLNLPGENGLVATARIRNSWPMVCIIVLTGDFAAASAHDAILAGASGFLRKEDAADELVRAVREVCCGKVYLSPDAATVVTKALLAKPVSAQEPQLSERETAVLKGLAEGRSYKEIASELQVSPKSVETYRVRLVKKIGGSTRADLIRYAIRSGLVKA